MTDHYDRNGNPMPMMEWAKAMNGECHVGDETLPNGVRVSTVWIGLDHSFGKGPPLIFESMAFAPDRSELDMKRYSTEDEAKEGHAKMVEAWRSWKP